MDSILTYKGATAKLVFVHDAGSSSLAFYYQLRHFRNSKAIDLPGHPTGKPCASVDGYVEWVRGFNTARRYKDVVLCGHSMGGAIAMQYALRYPDELKGIILIGTGALLRVNPDYLQICESPGLANTEWLDWETSNFKSVEPDIHQVLVQRAEEIGPEVQLNDLMACNQFDVMEEVHNIRIPTRIVCGSQDIMTPVKYSDYLADRITGSKEDMVSDATHYVQLDKYHEVNQKIEEFMTSLK